MQSSRRDFVGQGGAALGALSLINTPFLASAFPSRAGEEVLPWLDQPPANPEPNAVRNLLHWQELDSWITPNEEFFAIGHYNWPTIDEQTWTLEIGGKVARPLTFTLEQLRARPRQEVVFTLECSGNHGFPWFIGGIGTARWAGTPLAPVLEEAGVLDDGREVIFFGTDQGEEEVREIKTVQSFGRSMALADAMNPGNLLCYEMNDAPLPAANGFPLRLIAPGWFGIANVKWLQRIEVASSRYMGRFMAKDYVTLREQQQDGQTVWLQTSVGRALIKSVPAKVTRSDGRHRIMGAAWGAPIERVEVRIDGGPWQAAIIDRSEEAEFAWKIWSLDWPDAAPGEHSVTSRAIDPDGNVQPASDDPLIANKRTYWESNGQVTRRVRI
ncbi:MAG TPA: sulfite oxidase [Geminicoccaceae bacterium]|nr:sulfite oxidase [Geminicoccaceae bacterium]